MAQINIKDVDDELYKRLQHVAIDSGSSVKHLVLEGIRLVLAQWPAASAESQGMRVKGNRT